MRGVNKVILAGHLGSDPEVRYFTNGDAVAEFSVATSESYKDKQTDEQKEDTEWHRVKLKKRLAEIAGEYLRKGCKVYLEGKNRTRKYTENDGIERYITEVHCSEMQMLDNHPASGQASQTGNQNQQAAPQQQQGPAPAATAGSGSWDDDIPSMRLHHLAGG